jgi:hypothetical protein
VTLFLYLQGGDRLKEAEYKIASDLNPTLNVVTYLDFSSAAKLLMEKVKPSQYEWSAKSTRWVGAQNSERSD